MRPFKLLSVSLLLLFILSIPFSGMWRFRVDSDNTIIRTGLYEPSLFLIIASCVLVIAICISYAMSGKIMNSIMLVGIKICNISMIMSGIAVIFCDFHALMHDLYWGESALLGFPVVIISALTYCIGAFVMFCGYAKAFELKSDK
ncbi:MAG: hypothetical protein AB9866_16125 [Syntrophobacteraceae bacterium]